MNRFLYIGTFFMLVIFSACLQHSKKEIVELANHNTGSVSEPGPSVVDYKADTYKISIGESYKISGKMIDWFWGAPADWDHKIDSTGKDVFRYHDRPLIKYKSGEYLRGLWIETDKNLITLFTCTVIFDMDDAPESVDEFLQLMSKDIRQLKNEKICESLKKTGHFQQIRGDYVEIFTLEKGDYDYARFEYTMKAG